MSPKTVFISYRRRDPVGKAFAGRICDALKHEGYDTFMDVYNTQAGDWKKQIFKEVHRRSHFLLVLTPGAFSGGEQDVDWMKSEYECASRANPPKNIVLVFEESVTSAELLANGPSWLKEAFELQTHTIRHKDFGHHIDELTVRYIAPEMAPDFDRFQGYQKTRDLLLSLLVIGAIVLTVWQMVSPEGIDIHQINPLPFPIASGVWWGCRHILKQPEHCKEMYLGGVSILVLGFAILLANVKKGEISSSWWVACAAFCCCGLGSIMAFEVANPTSKFLGKK